jgi:hypothetical protein
MDSRVPIDLARTGKKDASTRSLGEPEHVDGSMDTRLRGLHGISLVMDRGSGAGEVVNLIDLYVERECHVVPKDFEARVGQEMGDVVLGGGVIVVHTEDLIALTEEPLTQVRADETCSPGHQDSSGR